tara:strand:- start:702 stop:908 length:207 start_codon:yes stop_codon:yes gene_type:complete
VKFVLTLVLCNYAICTPAFEWPYKFESYYDCALTGYNAAILRLNDIGEDIVNDNRTTVLFTCNEIKEI